MAKEISKGQTVKVFAFNNYLFKSAIYDDSFKTDKEVLDLHQLVINTPYSLQ